MRRANHWQQVIVSLVAGAAVCTAGAQAVDSDNSAMPTEMQVAELLKKQPKAYQSHYLAGRLYESRGFYNEAEDEYGKAVGLTGVKPDAYKRLAQLALRSSDYNRAEKAATDGLHYFPKDYGMLLTAGYVLHNQNKLAPALNMYQRARAVNPKDAQICLAIADVYAAMQKPEQALLEVQQFEKLGKPNQLSTYEKAKILLCLKREDQALVELGKNFDADVTNFANNKLYATTLVGRGNKTKALEVALCLLANGQSKELESAKLRTTNLLTVVAAPGVATAISAAEARLSDQKIKARMHFALGDVYDRKELRELAVQQYQDGLKLNPQFARGHLRLGEDLEKRGDLKAALSAYKKAKALDTEKKDREIASRLQELEAKMSRAKISGVK